MANSKAYRIDGITNKDDFIIFKLSPNETIFYSFDDATQARNYILEAKDKCFYETIRGSNPQKARFDIDIDSEIVSNLLTPELIVNDLIYAILAQFKSMNIILPLTHILIYDSSGHTKDKYKYSYHIVIDHYYHSNNSEACDFFLSVREKIHNRSIDYVDPSVYKSLQQFRMIGNTKYGDNRHKRRLYEWNYNGTLLEWKRDDDLTEYYRSLINPRNLSLYTRIPIKSLERIRTNITNNTILPSEKINPFIPEGFELGIITEHGYHIKRIFRSLCLICERVHDNENSYIKVINNTVILKCFRKLESSFVLGCIEEDKEVINTNKTILNKTLDIAKAYSGRKKVPQVDRSESLLKSFAKGTY